MSRVYVSPEMIAIVVSSIGVAVTVGIALFGGLAWVIRRTDDRIESLDHKLSDRITDLDTKLSARIDALDSTLSARIDAVDHALGDRIDGLARDLTEVKVDIARLEGSRQRLIVGN